MPSKPQLAALLLALAPLAALSQQIDDPANLMGERVSAPALADTLPIDHGAPALEQLLRKLRTRASMMLIVAHPDDEDGGLLTLESRGMGARVAMLTLTRGEGGQNLMTGDFNDALGLIRTQELLAEDRYTGTDQFFGTEVDFGFSKTKEESFKQWTHERVLYDAVRAVRLYRPLVLASVFIGGVTDGHGQHQVSGEIAQEVFLAAADPKVFPEMGLPAWAPLRVYARVPFAPITDQGMFDYATGKFLPPHFHNYVTGADTTTPPQATVTIHEGEVPSIPSFNGMSYIQWARQGLALQKTQIGPNVRIPPAGRVDVGYTLYGTRIGTAGCPMIATASPSLSWAEAVRPCPSYAPTPATEQDLFTGIDTSLRGIASLAPSASENVKLVIRSNLADLDQDIAEAELDMRPGHPELAAHHLRDGLVGLDMFIEKIAETRNDFLPSLEKSNVLHELRIKRVQLNNALVLALGIAFTAHGEEDAQHPEATTVSGDGHGIDIQVDNLGSAHLERATMKGVRGVIKELTPLKASTNPSRITFSTSFDLPASTPATKPYFERPSVDQPYYDILDANLRNAAATPDPLLVSFVLDYEGATLEALCPLAAAGTQDAIRVVPLLSLSLHPHSGIIPIGKPQFSVEAEVRGWNGPLRSTIEMQGPRGWRISPLHAESLSSSERSTFVAPYSFAPGHYANGETAIVDATTKYADRTYSEGYRPVGYPGLPYTNYYTPATYKATAVDVTTAPNLQVAYLPGTGDDVPQFLPSLGVTPTILGMKEVTADNLKQYDVVLLGVRAYSAHPELEGAGSAALNDYARQGGVVIAQYNSGGFDPASAPYPYTLPGDSAHNVVDEDQPVRLLAPDNPLLTWPNKITSADFDHWIEERGHGFATDWSPAYTPLLETHDPDQDPQQGGLLLAKTGKGAYLYCAFALYRQLPEGVPGAYRLLANLLSYAKNPNRK